MEKALVTGATGFIGKALVKYLLEAEVEVIALVLPGEEEILEKHNKLTVISGNLEHPQELSEKLKGIQFDVLYHLAWVGVSTTYKNDFQIQVKNIGFALEIMKMAKECGCKKVVCTGSVSEYAYVEGPVNGCQVPTPCDMYSASKASTHMYCDLFARQNEMQFHWVLIPSIYGPGRIDNNLITYSIKSLLAGERPSYTKLEQKWDYIYIDDLIYALFLVGEKGKDNTVYVTGSGNARPMSEYVMILRDQINPQAELGIGDMPYKTARIDNAIVDITRLKEDTGYAPRVSFEEGIKRTIEYFKEMEN